ncbi:MAG: MBL fold metallo-hydrolase [Candidatus Brocadiaceae bacterium]|nr:MBL fold metallo-hydrolase [Candidatus Brocadiaceae bacterium]
MTNPSFDLHMTYLGWSGFRFSRSDGPQILVDPPDVIGIDQEREAWILLSHGHSEHVAGTSNYLTDPTRVASATVLASPPVCRYLKYRYGRKRDRFIPCLPGDVKTISDLRVDVFSWRHMPLLPSGLGPILRHLFRLVLHPNFTLKIMGSGLKYMKVGPMLGFRLVPKKGPRLLLYSEGLHQYTSKIEVKETGQLLNAEILLFAVRPEDTQVIPELVSMLGASVAVPYEAHKYWRKGFGLPVADLTHITTELNNRGFNAIEMADGKTIILS